MIGRLNDRLWLHKTVINFQIGNRLIEIKESISFIDKIIVLLQDVVS